jgi:menaquinone-dependent protoporphyrinogen oxidase
MLILYSTTDGHTREICERLQSVIEGRGHQVTLAPVTAGGPTDLRVFEHIIIGASIRYGKHNPLLFDFINRNANLLNSRPGAFFSVSVAARKPKNSRPETNAYMQAFLRKVAWHPTRLAVFAGKIDYPRYRSFDRMMIRLIMWLTGGPTDPQAVVDFTDWRQVEEFGATLVAQARG